LLILGLIDYTLLRLKELFLNIHIKSLINQLKGLIPGKEGGKEHLAIDSSNGNTIIKHQRIIPLLDLGNILSRNVNKRSSKKYSSGVELRVETQPAVCYEYSTLQNYLVVKSA
jgi:hypothetical protein